MMHEKYNLFFATGSKQYLEFLLTCNVKNILISFAYSEPWALRPLIKRNNIHLLCDSGAFTSWNIAQKTKREEIAKRIEDRKQEGDFNDQIKEEIIQDIEKNGKWKNCLVDREKYLEHILKYQDIIYRAVNLDVIPGEQGRTPSQEEIIKAAEEGWENYLWFKSKGINTIHVFHYGEPFEYLQRMLDNCDYIGVSPSNDLSDSEKEKWLDQAFRYILNSNNSNIKTHGFGVTSKRLVQRYPWFSSDSSSYSLTAAMGGILTPYGRIYISDQNQGDPDHILRKPQEIQEHINNYLLENIGYNIDSMTRNIEEYTSVCRKCGNESPAVNKTQSYKPRNFANIIHFLNLEEQTRNLESRTSFMNQGILF